MNNTPIPQLNSHELLMLNQGSMSVTFIPTSDTLPWVIPTALIIGIQACTVNLKQYEWQGHMLPVFSLLAKGAKPESLVILEGERDQQRIALLIQGQLRQQLIKITDIKDIENKTLATASSKNKNNGERNYSYQQVSIGTDAYMVPDLKRLSKQLLKTA